MPVIGFDTFEEAIEIANKTPFGLQGGVISRDMSLAIARRCQA
jgi:succinate-semialdehyde dehydrogenase/glutarate-semialdehyde dehydrogenase